MFLQKVIKNAIALKNGDYFFVFTKIADFLGDHWPPLRARSSNFGNNGNLLNICANLNNLQEVVVRSKQFCKTVNWKYV